MVNGAWAVYIAESVLNRAYLCPIDGCPPSTFAYVPYAWAVVLVGGVLIIDSLISFAGIRATFILGAVLSVAVLAIVAIQWGTYSGIDASVALALSLFAVVADFVASRPVRGLSEQTNPMNLPVFG